MPAIPENNDLDSLVDFETQFEDFVNDGRGWEALACLVKKVRHFDFAPSISAPQHPNGLMFEMLNQLTVNCYAPGEGIGSHVDTPSAFADGLISISLSGGTVMEFRKVGADHRIPGNKKYVYLPQRSMVLMSGPARFDWEHMIVTRKTDTHNGKFLPRSTRVSLTLRTAIDCDGPLVRVESTLFPPRWGMNIADNESIATPTIERDHVHAVYDAIATQWHHTRGKRGVLWPGATQWIKNLSPGSIVADVGCGDGKYFPAFWEAGCYMIGLDISLPLLKTTFLAWPEEDTPEIRQVSGSRRQLRNRPALAVADCMNIPLRSKSCDAAIAVAVMHHLSTEARRRRCIEELVRIVKIGGTINIQAWAIEQDGDARRTFAATDVFVPFNAQPKYLDKVNASKNEPVMPDASTATKSIAQVYSEAYEGSEFDEKKGLVVFQRYCHLYRKGELESLADQISGTSVIESYYEKGNHCIVIQVLR
jgi:alkylated DNA repair protein alkB family protein 8